MNCDNLNTRCKWCGREADLIKAHILPKKFYETVKQGDKKALLVSVGKGDLDIATESWQSGIHDDTIICHECDNRLGLLDNYAYSQFLKLPDESSHIYDKQYGIPVGYSYPDLDISKIKRFLLSVIWRAHQTKHEFFKMVGLGVYEERVRLEIESDRIIPDDDWAVVAIRYFDAKADGGLYPPFLKKLGGVNIYSVSLPLFHFMVKMDRRLFPDELRQVQLSKANGSAVLRMEFAGSPHGRYLSQFVKLLRERRKEPFH